VVGKTVSHYKILEKLGEGGMGVVYKAEDTKLTRTVALKFLPHGLDAREPERARFLQEARAAAILNHPNICTIYDIQEYEGQLFILMEYVEGKTLREIVPVKKMQDAIGYAIQIAEALEEAHAHAIVHRDIKAENIMVNAKNQVKVMDFGLAKLKGSLKLTRTGAKVGTLAYMAPEQIRGEQVDARSDIFSFGIVLYETFTGHLPFRGEYEAAMIHSILNEDPEPLQQFVSAAPSELLHVLDRALEKDREERYQTVHEMLIDLRRLKKDSAGALRQPHHDTPLRRTEPRGPAAEEKAKRRKRVWFGAAALVALSALSVLMFLPKTPAVRLNPNRYTVPLPVDFKDINYPSLSGDGNWVVFPAQDESETYDLYSMNAAGGNSRKVTDDAAYYLETADVSPDVSQIVYDCMSQPNTAFKVKLVPFQGGASRTLADTGAGPKWSPDGTRIGYMRVGFAPSVSGKPEIWSVRQDGTDRRFEFSDTVSTSLHLIAFSWSPDGESIAWVRTYPEGHGEVMVRKLATGKERQITFEKKTVDEVTWAKNNEILFASSRSGVAGLWMIPAGGGEATQVIQGGGYPILAARISTDNRTLVYLQKEWIRHIWVSALDGSNARQLTSRNVFVTTASFSPDGNHIAYVSGQADWMDAQASLCVMDRNGKNEKQLTSGSKTVLDCRWSPDGRWIAYCSRAVGEPDDSISVYLVEPFNLGPPRRLCRGKIFRWLDRESLVVFTGVKTLRYVTDGSPPTQIYQDSTFAIPIQDNKQIVYEDFRKGQGGWWVVSIDALGKKTEAAKKILPSGVAFGAPPDWRFLIYRNQGDEMCRVWTSSGKAEPIGKALHGDVAIRDVSMDGKEILWLSWNIPSKLVLVRNLFE
jgi:serine/threonine protein kinase/WD40 repeat protein